jgi:regulator of RNase E activity RraA
VLYGAIRDARTLRQGSFPVFAAGVTHRGPYKDGPGEINVPISIGGMVIEPGDLVIGDDDGVLCIAFDQVASVLTAAQEKSAAEVGMMRAIQDGTQNIDWIDAALKQKGCVFEG